MPAQCMCVPTFMHGLQIPPMADRKHNYQPLYSHHVDLRILDALVAVERPAASSGRRGRGQGCSISFRRSAFPSSVRRQVEHHCRDTARSRACDRLVGSKLRAQSPPQFTLVHGAARCCLNVLGKPMQWNVVMTTHSGYNYTAAGCEPLCAADPGCTHFSHSNKTGVCLLYSECAELCTARWGRSFSTWQKGRSEVV